MTFKLKSGNKPQFKQVGSSPAKDMKTGKYSHSFESPAKHFVDDVPEHNDGHSDDLQTPEEHEAGKVESPAKKKGDYRESNLLKAVPNKEAYDKLSDINKKGFDAASKKAGFPQKSVKKSPAKQTDTTYADGSKKSKREQDFSKRHTAEKAKDKYWYKIDGKKATKAQYLKYENKPGNMEGGGKQTNNPDVYGRIASNHGRGPKTK